MRELTEKGYAEEVQDGELATNDGKVWYIPHHGMYHPKKPDKIRVVFDCSATFLGESLNKHLLSGPDLKNGLVSVLCHFREPLAFMCDLEAMFHQFKVDQNHRNFQRFLWWPNGDIKSSPKRVNYTSINSRRTRTRFLDQSQWMIEQRASRISIYSIAHCLWKECSEYSGAWKPTHSSLG